MSDSSNNEKNALDRTTVISAILLGIPPVLALIGAAFPQYVPIPFVDVKDPASARPVFLVLGIGLAVINLAFLLLVRRMLDR
jgi:hypothetical protein